MSEKTQNEQFILGFLIASSISIITVLIFHPLSGKQTRKLCKKTAEAMPQIAADLSSTIQIQTRNLSFTVNKKWHKTLRRLRVAIKAGVEASKNFDQQTP
jgi:gas vesicle protein